MLELSRFLLRRSVRRRPAGVPPGAAEICELRLLLSAAAAGEVTDAAAAAVDVAVEPPVTEAAPAPPGEEGPGEDPGEDPVDEPGGESPGDIEVGGPYFDSLRSSLSNDGTQVIVTGNVRSLTGGDTVTFAGAATGSVTVNADGNFSFTFDYNGNGIVSATAIDLNGTVGETQFLFL